MRTCIGGLGWPPRPYRFVLLTDFRTYTHLNNGQKLKTNSPSFSFIHWIALYWKKVFVCVGWSGAFCPLTNPSWLVANAANCRDWAVDAVAGRRGERGTIRTVVIIIINSPVVPLSCSLFVRQWRRPESRFWEGFKTSFLNGSHDIQLLHILFYVHVSNFWLLQSSGDNLVLFINISISFIFMNAVISLALFHVVLVCFYFPRIVTFGWGIKPKKHSIHKSVGLLICPQEAFKVKLKMINRKLNRVLSRKLKLAFKLDWRKWKGIDISA